MYIENKKDAGKEMHQSAILLIVVGFVGVVFLLLEFFKVTSLLPSSFTSPLFYVMMGGLFLLFFVMGIMSIGSSKKMIEKGNTEENISNSIMEWFMSEYSRNKVDELIEINDESEEELYLMRTEKITTLICEKYPDEHIDLVRSISDKLFSKLYD